MESSFLLSAVWGWRLAAGGGALSSDHGSMLEAAGLPGPSSSAGLRQGVMGYWVRVPRGSLRCLPGGAGLLELVLPSWIWGGVGLPVRSGTFSLGSCHPLTCLSRPV